MFEVCPTFLDPKSICNLGYACDACPYNPETICKSCGWYPLKCKGLVRACVEKRYVSYKGDELVG